MIRFVFMGSDAIALPMLNYLKEQKEYALEWRGIFTQPDRPTGRGQQISINPIKKWAIANQILVLQPQKITDAEVEWLKSNRIDLVLVMAYGHLLPKRFLAIPTKGIFNLHASLLPKYRGASPIEAAIIEGESFTGISLMEMVLKMDAGAVADQHVIPINVEETSLTLREKMAQGSAALIKKNLTDLMEKKLRLIPQSEGSVSYIRKLYKADGLLDFTIPACNLERKIRAFVEWPGTFFEFKNVRIIVKQASAIDEDSPKQPGTVLSADPAGLCIATGNGILKINKLQRAGGKTLTASDFLRGFPIEVGTHIATKLVSVLPLVTKTPLLLPKINTTAISSELSDKKELYNLVNSEIDQSRRT
jgi:methionyl-tRNA formyltransferase